jgi:hypothetical protein
VCVGRGGAWDDEQGLTVHKCGIGRPVACAQHYPHQLQLCWWHCNTHTHAHSWGAHATNSIHGSCVCSELLSHPTPPPPLSPASPPPPPRLHQPRSQTAPLLLCFLPSPNMLPLLPPTPPPPPRPS